MSFKIVKDPERFQEQVATVILAMYQLASACKILQVKMTNNLARPIMQDLASFSNLSKFFKFACKIFF